MNTRTRIVGLCTSALVVISTLGLTATAAYADEVPLPDESSVVSTETTIAPEEITPEPETALPEGAPAPVAALRTTTVKLDICHSGSGTNWTWISPDASGYNGHQHHDADIYGLGETACLAKNVVIVPEVDQTPFVLIAWPMASWIDDRHPTWPQGTKAGLAAPFISDLATRNLSALDSTLNALVVPCGTSVQYQVDGNFDTPEVRAAIAGGYLDGPGDPAEALWGGGWDEAYKLVKIDGPVCEEEPTWEQCETSVTHPTATNLDQDGWNIKPNRGEFVEGGLHLFSTADSSGWAQKQINTEFKNVGNLSTLYSEKTGPYTFGVILTLNDWDQQIHYDEDGRYWTNIAGIFPESTLKGGYYETYNLEADLLQPELNIQTIVLYVNAGQGGLVIHSQGYQCGTQPFDHEYLTSTVCETSEVQPTATNLNTRGWTLVNGEFVDGGVKLTSSNWEASYAHLDTNFPLSEASKLDYLVSGGDIWAIILETADGNIHYEPSYTDSLWANHAGVLPRNAVNPGDNAGQGGPYSGSLDTLLSDPTVTGVKLYHTSGSAEPVSGILHSGSYNCLEQPFDRENIRINELGVDLPSASDVCGTEDDTFYVPEDGEIVTWDVDDQRVDGVGDVTISASLPDGYEFPEELQTSWTFTFTDVACPVTEEPTPTPTPETPEEPKTPTGLPNTGADGVLTLGGVALAIILLGGVVLFVLRTRRNSAE